MNQIEIQRKVLIAAAGLVLVSIVFMIITIPSVLKDTSAGATPESAATGIVIMIILHMVVLFGFWKAIRTNKQGCPADKGLNIGLGILILLFGLAVMDGAFAFFDQILFVSILLFISVFCDFVAAITSFSCLFIKPKNNNKIDL